MNDNADHSLGANSGPLSYGQRALWFLQQLAPQSAAYNVMLAARTDSAIDVDALRRAFQNLVNRHASLRTIFPAIKGKPVQRVQPRHEVDFRVIDAESAGWDDLQKQVAEESHEPFDLEKGPVLRVRLFKRSSREHILSLAMHHIVVDFVSFVIILDELRAFYAAETTGAALSLPELKTQYLDYARSQVEMLEGVEGERLWVYWRMQLSADPPSLSLRTDRPRLPVQKYRGATQSFKIGEEMTRRLRSRVATEGVGLFTLLLASFQILLSRYSGQRQILVGCPPVGSRQAEFQGVVGFFHNPVVLRADLSGDPTIRQFLNQVSLKAAEAFDHQAYPFPLLVERLQPARDLSRSPLFQVMFVLYETGSFVVTNSFVDLPEKGDRSVLSFLAGEAGARIDLGGAELESLGLEQQAAMLDVTLTVVQSDGFLTAAVQYNTDLFDASTIMRMMNDYELILEAVTDDAEQRVSDLLSMEVIGVDRDPQETTAAIQHDDRTTKKQIDFSLFYFASDHNEPADDKYRLLLEGARFADRNGFSAVWTPERHFHAFGGLYPNPSVTGAAIATITNRVHIRAGSVVLPLHNPVRVAEEWAVVDNLSKGRVGISFASGWHSDDFVFAPENFANRRQIMASYIETVRKLWRGESVTLTGGAGDEVHVKILPRPIQSELPVWITAFGSLETFRLAGEIGANMLTHLLGQSVELLAEKIKVYRDAWRDHSHGPGSGHVTLMLHTFVGADYGAVRDTVREPFCSYLRSSLDLLIGLSKVAGIDIDPADLTQENVDAVVAHAFNRYYDSCGLFGTPDTCARTVEKLRTVGVDEIACLIDFGVDTESVLSSLRYLKVLKETCETKSTQRRVEDGIDPVGSREETADPFHTSTSLDETRNRAESRRSLMARQRISRDVMSKKTH